ncbi:uncharacterized protein LOC119378769 [Rhipicephalus sanguineus]|uniref:uncharacterized protein LOC119378769 n=1 Tax=Rhipicephalus sanguineus TaxID=34632 RepID=UPI0018945179|nr:uncharacterized protein LOC119378769 [Rhipicephalus sanguineus]
MPRTAERVNRRGYCLSTVATRARWPPEQRPVTVPPAASRWGPPRPRPVNSQALRAEESASPFRKTLQDWELLQKALTFQSEMEDGEEEDAGAARSEAEDAKK